MKFSLRTIGFFILMFAFATNAQNTKHIIRSAKIIYNISYTSTKSEAVKPMEYILYFKNDMSRVEMKSDKGTTVMISDNLANVGYILMDRSGQKMAMKIDQNQEIKKQGITKDPKVEITRESKVIAGYTCYKAIITSETDSVNKTYNVWFTNDIKGNYSYDTKIKGINGLMMEFTNERDGKIYKMTATKVEVENNLSDDLFIVPSDYIIMDVQSLQGKMKK